MDVGTSKLHPVGEHGNQARRQAAWLDAKRIARHGLRKTGDGTQLTCHGNSGRLKLGPCNHVQLIDLFGPAVRPARALKHALGP